MRRSSFPDNHRYRSDSKDWPRGTDEIQYFMGKGGSFAVVIPLGGDRYRAVANTPGVCTVENRLSVDPNIYTPA